MWKTLGTNDAHQEYVNQRDYCVFLANTKLREFYKNILGSTSNQSTLFNTVSALWNRTRSKALPTKEKDIATLANKFNHFFIDKIENIHETFPTLSAPIISELDMPQYESECSSHLHSFQRATLEELENIISSNCLLRPRLMIHCQNLFIKHALKCYYLTYWSW